MSKHTPGQAGPVRGKMGQSVFSSWRGIGVGKAAPKKSTKLPTADQLGQRSKFGMVTSFLSDFSGIINIGYPSKDPKMTAMNLATKYHLDNAVTGVKPNYLINYPAVQFTTGKLDRATAVAAAVEGRAVTISWLDTGVPSEISSDKDRATVIFYSTKQKKFLRYSDYVDRDALTITLNIPFVFGGESLHAYLFFKSVDGKLTSKTDYVGLIPIAV
jgi:hypothetical protein